MVESISFFSCSGVRHLQTLLIEAGLVPGAHPALSALLNSDALLLTKPLNKGFFSKSFLILSMVESISFFSCSGVRHLQTLLIEAGSVPGAHPALSALQSPPDALLLVFLVFLVFLVSLVFWSPQRFGAPGGYSNEQPPSDTLLLTKPLNNGSFSKSFLILSIVESMMS